MPVESEPHFRWICGRCARPCDERIRDGWGPAFALCTCGLAVELEVRRELDGRVLRIAQRA